MSELVTVGLWVAVGILLLALAAAFAFTLVTVLMLAKVSRGDLEPDDFL